LGEFTFLQGSSAPDYTANTTIDFKGVAARCVRLVVNSSWDTFGVHGLSEVRFLYIPTRARKPCPESGAEGVDTDVVLTWRAGRDAVSHEVYFGTDEQAVADGTVPVDIVATSAYGPGALDLETTYHWKINEVNEAEPVVLWAGDVWHFTTQDSFVVDDFESYSGGDGHEILNTWRDGKRAVEMATRACALTDWKDHEAIGTLAAAYSQIGDFNNAVKWQQEAVNLLPVERRAELETEYQGRLERYGSGRPYSEGM
jgi:hypothetical protein